MSRFRIDIVYFAILFIVLSMILMSIYYSIIITNFMESKKLEIVRQYDENMKKTVYELMNKYMDKYNNNIYNNTQYIYNSTFSAYWKRGFSCYYKFFIIICARDFVNPFLIYLI